jgi:hypothetical protein
MPLEANGPNPGRADTVPPKNFPYLRAGHIALAVELPAVD